MKKILCSFSMFFSITCICFARDKGLYVVPSADLGFTLSHNADQDVGGYFGLYTKPAIHFNYMFNHYVGITSGLGWEYFSYDVVHNYHSSLYDQYKQHVQYLSVPLMIHFEALRGRLSSGWLWANAGFSADVLLKADYKHRYANTNSNNWYSAWELGGNNADMNGLVISARTGFGWGFCPDKNTEIIFGFNLKQSLSRTQKENPGIVTTEANGIFAAFIAAGCAGSYRQVRYEMVVDWDVDSGL